MHVAGGLEGCVECERRLEGVGCLTAFAELEVIAKQLFVGGVCAIVDNAVSALHGVESAEVGNTLVGDDNIDGVLGVVDVRCHGHDIAYQTSLGD